MLEPRGIGLIYDKNYYGEGVPPSPLFLVCFVFMDVPDMLGILDKDLMYSWGSPK
jgi:hypothetical protein